MALDLFDDVFLLHLPLEAAKGVLQSFALLKPNFSQTKYTSNLNLRFPCVRRGQTPFVPLGTAAPRGEIFLRFAQKVLIS
jgi:hypothetical protein